MQIMQISEHLQNSSIKEISPIAHHMRSSCANIGAEILSSLCYRLEYLEPSHEYTFIAGPILGQLENEYKIVKDHLMDILANPARLNQRAN
jgi:HPt (histidine-containing phosphotransfer) domain-containing protein